MFKNYADAIPNIIAKITDESNPSGIKLIVAMIPKKTIESYHDNN